MSTSLTDLERLKTWDGKGPFPSSPAPQRVVTTTPPVNREPVKTGAKATKENQSLDHIPTAPRPTASTTHGELISNRSEPVLLGSVIRDGDRIAELLTLRPKDFGLDSHRKIFHAMLEMHKRGRGIDFATLQQHLGEKLLKSVGGAAYLAILTEDLPRNVKLQEHANIIREKAQLRAALKIAEEITARVESGEALDVICALALERYSELSSEQPSAAGELRLLKGTEIVEQDQPAILPDRIFDQTTIGVHGRPGDGKTTGVLLIAADLSRGRTPYTGTPCEPRNILVMSNEDSPSRIRKLFTAAGGDLDHLLVENSDDLWQLSDLVRLEESISTHSIGCVVVDSLASHSGKADLNSHQDTAQLLVPMRALAEKYRCAIFVIHHLNKLVTADHIAKVAGSIGITASFRHNIHVVPDPENPDLRLMVNGKSNLAPPNVPALCFQLFPVKWEGESAVTIDELYQQAASDTGERPAKALEWLKTKLADGQSHTVCELQEKSASESISRSSLFRAATKLNVKRIRGGFGGGGSWMLRDSEAATK